MLYAGLDLSRKRLDFHLLDYEGATVEVGAAPPDADGLRSLTQRLERHGEPLCSVPGISWVLAYTIAAEIGDIGRFPTPRKLAGYSGLCPRVYQSGERDLRGRLSKQGPRYLRWALVEAATHACTHPIYRDRYQQTKAPIGRQRGAKVA
jgi:transposase